MKLYLNKKTRKILLIIIIFFLIAYTEAIVIVLYVWNEGKVEFRSNSGENHIASDARIDFFGVNRVVVEWFQLYDEEELLTEIEEILGAERKNYAIYVKVINQDFEIGINEEKVMYPASIFKVPIAILVLSDIEEGKYSLDTMLEVREEHKFYASDTLYYYENGTELSVRTCLDFMIRYSDNTAWDMLMDQVLGNTSTIDRRIKEELELEHTTRAPFETKASDIGKVLEGLYTYEYINEENSEYLLDLLSNIVPSQNDRIPAGLPDDVRVAHKIGTWIGNYEDAGIIYGEYCDYILVILNINTSVQDARTTIASISRASWEHFDLVNRKQGIE